MDGTHNVAASTLKIERFYLHLLHWAWSKMVHEEWWLVSKTQFQRKKLKWERKNFHQAYPEMQPSGFSIAHSSWQSLVDMSKNSLGFQIATQFFTDTQRARVWFSSRDTRGLLVYSGDSLYTSGSFHSSICFFSIKCFNHTNHQHNVVLLTVYNFVP